MEFTPDEKLALLVAMDKQIKPALNDAKSEARAKLMAAYDDNGTSRIDIQINGQKVGDVGITRSKAKPCIYDMRAAMDYLRQIGCVVESPADGWENQFTRYMGHVIHPYATFDVGSAMAIDGDSVINTDTGEVVADIVDGAFGWEPESIKTPTVRGCKPQDVIDAFNGRLAAMNVTALLEG